MTCTGAAVWRRSFATKVSNASRVKHRGRIDDSAAPVFALAFERFQDQIVASGALTKAEMNDFLAAMNDPTVLLTSPLLVSAWGWRPA